MNEFFNAIATYTFLQNALLAGLLSSIVCGVTGVFVVIKRISYISGGIAHAVLGGVGIAYYLGLPPIWGAFTFAIIAAFIIGIIKLKSEQHEDTVIGALWATGMAVGVIFMYLAPGYNVDLLTYLFGNILMVTETTLTYTAVFTVLVVSIIFIFFRQFVYISFDQEYAKISGLNINFFYLLLLGLIALTIVALIQIVGLILVIALLTLPAAIAGLINRTPGKMMITASLLGLLFTFTGIFLSFSGNLPAGATIVMISGFAYLLAVYLKKVMIRKFNRKTSK
ncbi:MAG: metal ABC transporter permease [Candidatus Cloacimonetes bacterium]|nr:metal ABC transporter permease [Candidatus Cloacimonadota bacterium]